MANSIYELTNDWLAVYNMADDPEIDDQTWFDTMEGIEGEIEIKAENTAKVIKQIEADASAIKAEADRLSKRAKALTNRADWLKKNIEKSMIATGKTKFKTDLFSFGIQKNPPQLQIKEDADIDLIPPEYLIFADPTIDKNKVKEAIKAGSEFDWATLVQAESLRIR